MTWILVTQIIVSLLLILSILVQANGLGVGRTLGSTGANYHTKRGAEKALFITTIFLSSLFLILSLLNLVLSQ